MNTSVKSGASLDARDLPDLAAQVAGIGTPAATPIADAVTSGRAPVHDGQVHLAPAERPGGSVSDLASSVASLDPRTAELQISGDQYSIMAQLNPWIQVVAGTITATAAGPWNKGGMGPGWVFVNKPTLLAAGINPSAPVGSPWPPGGGGAFTVPSATYNPASMPSLFHALPHAQLPSVPTGYSWTGGGSAATPYVPMRDPVVRPASPRFDVDANDFGGRVTYTSSEADPTPTHPANRRVLSAFAETAPSGGGFPGARNYPMTRAEYTDPAGQQWGRGHAVDHFDGDAMTTSAPTNYVPENDDFNMGARNHLVQEARKSGPSAWYSARYQYPAAPTRTADSTAIPFEEDFLTQSSAGAQQYWEVDNFGYPASRKKAAATPYSKPPAGATAPPWH